MQISVDDAGATATVILNGRLDIAGAEVVATPLATLSGAKKGLIVDLSSVTFLASIGIRHLVSATKTLSRRGGRLVLLNPSQTITEVLEMSGVTDLMPIARSADEAQAAMGAATA